MNEEPEFLVPRVRVAGRITLAEPDPVWPAMFAVRAGQIRRVLGSRALLVEHAGSTSVAGLVAKPIIDIVLVVADPADESAYVSRLESAGFTLHLREPHWHEHRLLRDVDPDTNLHVFGPGSVEVVRILAFRDWLRDHTADRDAYAAVKRELADRDWEWVQDYADAKTTIVERILAKAGAV